MITREQKSYNTLIINALSKISRINKCRKDFLIEILVLFLSIKGRINFLQFGRYGNFKEQRYRQQFEKPFPFIEFNKELLSEHGGKRFVIAFDPSYISKSGKKTPGLDWYLSGCPGQAKWVLEIGGLAAINLENQPAFLLEAIQIHIEDKQDNFNINAPLAAINIAKVEHWLNVFKDVHKPFSINDIKIMNHNRLLLQ